MEMVFDSGDFPARDALAAWAEITSDAVMPTSFQMVDTDVFRGRLSTMPLGAVQVSAMAYSSYLARRTPKLIRASDPEILAFSLMNSGPHVMEQNRNRAALQPGQLVLVESSHPFETCADGGNTLIQFPRALLPLPARHVDRIICRALPGDQGIGRLLTAFLTHVTGDGTDYTPQDAARLGTVGLDLVAATLAHYLDREGDVPSGSRQRVLYLRITAFIHHHLGDPELTPAVIAAVHHVSIRYLHRLFQDRGTTVMSFIRTQRLDRCRHDLANPGLARLPVQAIAARWGFTHPADFSRAFRGAYGTSPSEYRRLAAQCAPG